MSDKNKHLCLGFVFLIAGLIFWSMFAFNFWNEVTTSIRVNKWSSTQGTIISSNLEKCGKNNGVSLSEISYSYLVKNTIYTGNKIEPYLLSSPCEETFLGDNNKKQVLMDKYRTNANIYVYFNSQQPSNSFVLIDDLNLWRYFKLIILLSVMLLFSGVFIKFFRISIKSSKIIK